MSEEDLEMSNAELIKNLGLIENGKLKRAAFLLFHRNPEKWVTGTYIKLGKFGKNSDLQYQDEVKGFLILQADIVIDLINFKIFKSFDLIIKGLERKYILLIGLQLEKLFTTQFYINSIHHQFLSRFALKMRL